MSWGAGDFSGGLATRRCRLISTMAAVQWFGFALCASMVVISAEPVPPMAALVWGAAAGASGAVGLTMFYGALSRGLMSLVAPVAALVGATVPALVGVARGDALDPPQVLGMILALVAVVIISKPTQAGGSTGDPATSTTASDPSRGGRALPMAILAGFGFAGFFLFLDLARGAGGGDWWPIVGARLAGSLMVLAAVLVMRTAPTAPLRVLPLLVIATLGDLGGTLFFSLAIESGPLSLATVLSSLYPVTTVILAWLFLRERLARAHLVGVALALGGVALISI